MKRMLQIVLILVINFSFFPIIHAALHSPIENKINHYIVLHQQEALSLLERLVNINSGTDNIEGIHQVGEILRSELNTLGFKTQWMVNPPSMHRAATLIAKRQGTSGKRLLLIGHLDTVFPPQHPFQTFKRQENRAMGPGVIDDKGGDIVILYALKALHANQALKNTSITVVLTSDEEDSGKPTTISRKPLMDAAKQRDVALDFEFAMTKNSASIARRGVVMWKLHAQGKEAHAADIFRPEVGYGAIFEISRILNRLGKELSTQKDLSFNPGLIAGGTSIHLVQNPLHTEVMGKDNVVANIAMASGDLRYLFNEQKLVTKKKVKAIVNQHLPGTNATIEFEDGIPPMSPTDNNLKLLETYSKVSRDLGFGTINVLDPKTRGAGDISYVAAMVPANLVGLGPFGQGAHSANETLEVDSLTMQAERAAILIYRLTHPATENNQ